MIWFTADFHLSHKNIIDYCNRPFNSIEEMDKAIIKNLEECVKSSDMLYFLGDLTFKQTIARDFFERFNDLEIHFIIGNHDSKEVIKLAEKHCISISNLKDIIIEDQSITLCHYAMRVWNKSHFNAWQLYGHSHAGLSPIGKQYDVGVDNNHFFPVSFENLKVIMKKQPDN
ncbi:MAG: metallophosphoesterase, partial [Candidatus Hermodarchaeota archaeon]